MPAAPISVSELTARIKQELEQGFSHIKVIGEVSRLVRHGSGHLYFTIKDAGASLSAVIWRSTLERMTLHPEDGQEYIFSGHISLYEPRGSYQLIVRRVELSGSGALAAEFERKKQEFARRGWFDAGRKQIIPEFPCHIGIVTSETAAALHDVIKVMASRPGWLRLTLSATTVQGAAASASIARAIQQLEQLANRPDVILVARGGGSMEDLWCFNEEAVVQAIVECPIPVITGIGHEIDVTLADFAADLRAATPSNAAELACADRDSLRANLPRLTTLRQLLQRQLNQARKNVLHVRMQAEHSWRLAQDQRHMHAERVSTGFAHACHETVRQRRLQLGGLLTRLKDKQPKAQFARRMRLLSSASQQLLDSLPHLLACSRIQIHHKANAMSIGLTHDIQHKRGLIKILTGRLDALSPYHVLSRGYALSMDHERRLITCRAALRADQAIRLLYHDGEARARVESTVNAAK